MVLTPVEVGMIEDHREREDKSPGQWGCAAVNDEGLIESTEVHSVPESPANKA
jgi:hypothetical protein